MMRRIELLPSSYAENRRQRQTITAIIGVGVALVLLLALWWFALGGQISEAEDELARTQSINAKLQTQIAELQEFADLELEVQNKTLALQTVMAGDIDWPVLMTEIAIVIPGEVWLESLQAAAALVDVPVSVGTSTALVDVNTDVPFGSVSFTGRALSLEGVGKWQIQLGTVDKFEAIWLSDALLEPATGTTPETASFTSTIELNQKATRDRFAELGGAE